VEIEVLMNMELVIESFPTEVEALLNRTGKERQVVKFLMKRRILMESAFQEKSKRIRKSIWEDLVSPRKLMDLSIVMIC
jgi:hypothetical protein